MKFLLTSFCLLISALAVAQRSEREPTKYKFLQAWVWQYQNDWIEPGEPGHSGELIVYFDSLSRAWLYDTEAFGVSGEGFDFIVGSYNGQYTFCFEDDSGKKRKTVRTVPEILSSRTDNALVAEEFAKYNKPTGETKVFGRNTYGWPIITGKEYLLKHLKTNEETTRYLAESVVDFQSLVYFNFIEGEVKLPLHFPTDIPLGKLLLEDHTVYPDGKKILLRLKEISDTEYHVDLSKYK